MSFLGFFVFQFEQKNLLFPMLYAPIIICGLIFLTANETAPIMFSILKTLS